MIEAEGNEYPDIMTYLRTEYSRNTIPERRIILREGPKRKEWILTEAALDYMVSVMASGFPNETAQLAKWAERTLRAWNE